MRFGFLTDERGVSIPRIAFIAGGLAIASLIGVRLLEAPLAPLSHASLGMESQTDLERLARSIPPAQGRSTGTVRPSPFGQIDFTATANSSGKRTLQSACHSRERTVSMIAPAGGPPTLLSTCAAAKN
ncbi:MAG: hypothetical protein QOH98_1199 [Methylobacteriaceae bacterium]|jgi:hypothetical protein|nr:hypothetical protein [Methylobacteriaceae bacterium]